MLVPVITRGRRWLIIQDINNNIPRISALEESSVVFHYIGKIGCEEHCFCAAMDVPQDVCEQMIEALDKAELTQSEHFHGEKPSVREFHYDGPTVRVITVDHCDTVLRAIRMICNLPEEVEYCIRGDDDLFWETVDAICESLLDDEQN